jgi:hypothetical protein
METNLKREFPDRVIDNTVLPNGLRRVHITCRGAYPDIDLCLKTLGPLSRSITPTIHLWFDDDKNTSHLYFYWNGPPPIPESDPPDHWWE